MEQWKQSARDHFTIVILVYQHKSENNTSPRFNSWAVLFFENCPGTSYFIFLF